MPRGVKTSLVVAAGVILGDQKGVVGAQGELFPRCVDRRRKRARRLPALDDAAWNRPLGEDELKTRVAKMAAGSTDAVLALTARCIRAWAWPSQSSPRETGL